MQFVVEDSGRQLACSIGIDIDSEARLGWSGYNHVSLIEAPAQIRRGVYDIGFIGAYTYLGGRETFIRHVSSIGRFCSIASNIVAGQVEHPTDFLSAHPLFQGEFGWADDSGFGERNKEMLEKSVAKSAQLDDERFGKITIGNDVWIGEGAFIRRGVSIGDGAVIAARSVVVKDVPPFAIVGGTPAKVIKFRFPENVLEKLLRLEWWKYDLNVLDGVDFTDIIQAIDRISQNIDAGMARINMRKMVCIDENRTVSLCWYDRFAQRLMPLTTFPDRNVDLC